MKNGFEIRVLIDAAAQGCRLVGMADRADSLACFVNRADIDSGVLHAHAASALVRVRVSARRGDIDADAALVADDALGALADALSV